MHAKFGHSIFQRFGDMVVAHQNLNGSRDLITGKFAIHGLAFATINLSTKFELYIFNYLLQRYERRYKISKMG